MDATEHKIRHVMFYVGLHPGHLMLVETTDGRYCIIRDTDPTPLDCWNSDQLPAAIDRYNELKAQFSPPTSQFS
jgi:hypothetical protein